MLNLREYKKKHDSLSDFLTWAALIAPGVVLNKDGSFQKSFRFRGPDLASATKYELLSIIARINNVLKRLPGGWVIWAEAQRVKSQHYPESTFPDKISFLIDAERKAFFEAGNHYESNYYFTLFYLPPEENVGKLEALFIERNEKREKQTYERYLSIFIAQANGILSLLREVLPEAEPLNDQETLTYLHSCVSLKTFPVSVPEKPMYLDAILNDTPLIGGLEPKLGKNHLRVISVLGFPGTSTPGILDGLNQMKFPYRWVTRFIPLDEIDAQNELGKYRRKWYSKRKGVITMLKEFATQSESVLQDTNAINKSTDADGALQEVADKLVNYGYFSMTVVLWDADAAKVEKYVEDVETLINGLGFTVINETLNAVDAWFGTLPGNPRANIRRPLFNSLNLAHCFPLSATWAGPIKNQHLKGPVLMYTETNGCTPFRFDLHLGDVGHTMIVGPTGYGKSALLAAISAQFRRYPGAQIYYFDKDASIRALTAGVGGDFYDLADQSPDTLAFQPLADIDDENERAWAAEWIYDLLHNENIKITPDIKKDVWTGLCSLATSPREERTISGLRYIIQNKELRQALQPYSKAMKPIEKEDGPFGQLLDADSDNLNHGKWQVFEMGKLMETKTAVPPTLSYLFHKLEQRLDGSPTLFVLDECWTLLDNPMFAAKIRAWLKVLRKANASVVFATQELEDVEKSTIAPTIMDACQTRIFLPNPNAKEERKATIYEKFNLNKREIEIISMATPKKQYYYKSPLGSRYFELVFGKIALAYCTASSKKDQEAIKNILAEHGKYKFNDVWLRLKGLPEVADWVQANEKEEYSYV